MVWCGYVLRGDLHNDVVVIGVLGGMSVKRKKCNKCIMCPKCNGAGEVTDKFLALMTFGVSVLIDDKDKCPKCKGRGWVK